MSPLAPERSRPWLHPLQHQQPAALPGAVEAQQSLLPPELLQALHQALWLVAAGSVEQVPLLAPVLAAHIGADSQLVTAGNRTAQVWVRRREDLKKYKLLLQWPPAHPSKRKGTKKRNRRGRWKGKRK